MYSSSHRKSNDSIVCINIELLTLIMELGIRINIQYHHSLFRNLMVTYVNNGFYIDTDLNLTFYIRNIETLEICDGIYDELLSKKLIQLFL